MNYPSNREYQLISDVKLPKYLEVIDSLEEDIFSITEIIIEDIAIEIKNYLKDFSYMEDYFKEVITKALYHRPKEILSLCNLYYILFSDSSQEIEDILLNSFFNIKRTGKNEGIFKSFSDLRDIFDKDSIGYYLRYDLIENIQNKSFEILKSREPKEFSYTKEDVTISTFPLEISNTGLSSEMIDVAAFFGSINCFKFLLLNGQKITDNTFSCSIRSGNLELIKLCKNIVPSLKVNDLTYAIEYRRNEIADWILENNEVRIMQPFDDCFKGNTRAFVFAFDNHPNVVRDFSDLKVIDVNTNYELVKFFNLRDFDIYKYDESIEKLKKKKKDDVVSFLIKNKKD